MSQHEKRLRAKVLQEFVRQLRSNMVKTTRKSVMKKIGIPKEERDYIFRSRSEIYAFLLLKRLPELRKPKAVTNTPGEMEKQLADWILGLQSMLLDLPGSATRILRSYHEPYHPVGKVAAQLREVTRGSLRKLIGPDVDIDPGTPDVLLEVILETACAADLIFPGGMSTRSQRESYIDDRLTLVTRALGLDGKFLRQTLDWAARHSLRVGERLDQAAILEAARQAFEMDGINAAVLQDERFNDPFLEDLIPSSQQFLEELTAKSEMILRSDADSIIADNFKGDALSSWLRALNRHLMTYRGMAEAFLLALHDKDHPWYGFAAWVRKTTTILVNRRKWPATHDRVDARHVLITSVSMVFGLEIATWRSFDGRRENTSADEMDNLMLILSTGMTER